MSTARLTSSAVPPGTCLIHGPFAGALCPTCSTAATIPGLNKYEPVKVKCPSCPYYEGCTDRCGWSK